MATIKKLHGAILLKPRFYSEIEQILTSDEVHEKVHAATRWLAHYANDIPQGEIVDRDGQNDPQLSRNMREDGGSLWTRVLELFPTSGGSDGNFLSIFIPWEIDEVPPNFGYWNSLTMSLQPLDIYDVLGMYTPESHEALVAQIQRSLNPEPLNLYDF